MGRAVHRREGCRRARSQSCRLLTQIDYTIPEAIERSGAKWVAVIPQVARQLAEEE
jgi:hypothetical protein